MFCLLVVLFKLSVLAKWLIRKTPLKRHNSGKESHKAQALNDLWLFRCNVLFRYFIACLSCLPAPHNIFRTPVARYSLLKSAVKHQSTCQSSHFAHCWTWPQRQYDAVDRGLSVSAVFVHSLLHRHTQCRTLRSASAHLLSVTRCNLSFGAHGFRTAAPAIWNSLPANVRSSATLSTFRRHLKSHLFQSSFPTA